MSIGNKVRTPVRDTLLQIAQTFSAAAESDYAESVEMISERIAGAFAQGNKLLVFGNGGSASDAQHFCGELVVKFQKDRRALPAIALCTDATVMTACANDHSFSLIFARQIEALGKRGDIALGISTSGNSANVVEALRTAQSLGLGTILLTGPKKGPACDYSDVVLTAPGLNTARIQELHLAAYHCICEGIEQRLFGES